MEICPFWRSNMRLGAVGVNYVKIGRGLIITNWVLNAKGTKLFCRTSGNGMQT